MKREVKTFFVECADLPTALAEFEEYIWMGVPEGEDWSLVGFSVQIGMKPAPVVSMMHPGQPQMQMSFIVIGALQKELTLAETIDESITKGINAALSKIEERMDEDVKYCQCAEPFRLAPTDQYCDQCGDKIRPAIKNP